MRLWTLMAIIMATGCANLTVIKPEDRDKWDCSYESFITCAMIHIDMQHCGCHLKGEQTKKLILDCTNVSCPYESRSK